MHNHRRDPATGLGTPLFPKLLKAAMSGGGPAPLPGPPAPPAPPAPGGACSDELKKCSGTTTKKECDACAKKCEAPTGKCTKKEVKAFKKKECKK